MSSLLIQACNSRASNNLRILSFYLQCVFQKFEEVKKILDWQSWHHSHILPNMTLKHEIKPRHPNTQT